MRSGASLWFRDVLKPTRWLAAPPLPSVPAGGSTADAIAAKQARVALEDRIAAIQLESRSGAIALARWSPNDAERPVGQTPDWRELPADVLSDPDRIAAHRELHAYEAIARAARTDIALARAEKRSDWSAELAYADRGPHLSSMLSVQFRAAGLLLFAASRQDPLIAANAAVLFKSGRSASGRARTSRRARADGSDVGISCRIAPIDTNNSCCHWAMNASRQHSRAIAAAPAPCKTC